MKNRLVKMMGVILTLAILAGLLMTAVPVSAGSLAWTNANVPNNTNYQITEATDASVYTMTPDGKNIFAYTSTTQNTTSTYGFPLFKSTDGGVTWSNTNLGTGLPGGFVTGTSGPLVPGTITQLAVSPSYATDTRVYAVSGTTLYRSLNAGQTWSADTTYEAFKGTAGTLGGVGTIRTVSIAPWYVSGGGLAVMVAGSGGSTGVKVAVYNDIDGWKSYNTNIAPDTFGAGFTDGEVLLSVFSPQFQSDAEILTVVQTPTSALMETKVGNSAWNTTVRTTEFKTYQGNPITSANGADRASIAFPSDYNYSSTSQNRVYVGLGNTTGVGAPFDVYRASGVLTTGTSTNIASNLALSQTDGSTNINSIAFTGTSTTGTLVVAFMGSQNIYNTANVAAGSPTWTLASNLPTGISARLRFAGTTLYAGTKNNAGLSWGSGFFTSTDYNSFKGISLISVPSLQSLDYASYKILGDTQFIMLKYTGTPASTSVYFVFKSSDKGATWGEVLASPSGQLFGTISPSPAFATDNTVYVTEYQNPTITSYSSGQVGPAVYKSSDAGATWGTIALTSPHQTIGGTNSVPANAFSPIDANSFWFGAAGSDGGGIFKSGSYTATATLDGYAAFVIAQTPLGIIVPTTTGEIYISTDQGATFTRLGNLKQFNGTNAATVNPTFTIDVPSKTIFSTDTGAAPSTSANYIYKWTVGTDSSWTQWTSITIPTGAPGAGQAFGVHAIGLVGGVLYVTVYDVAPPTWHSAGMYQMIRCTNLTSDPSGMQVFQAFPNTTFDNNGFAGTKGSIQKGPLTIVNDKFTGNTLYVDVSGIPTTGTTQPNNMSAAIFTFNDILTVPPGTSAPTPNQQIGTIAGANGSIVGAFTFAWKPVTSPVALTYSAQVATDNLFNGIVAGVGEKTGVAPTSGTSFYANNLVPGTKYFFRARVETPLASPWSAPVPFSVQLAGEAAPGLDAQGRMSPANGQTNVPLTPTFTWGAVSGAESYTLQVADNPFFANPTEKKPLTTTIWVWDTALKANTVYYWRVQAVAAGNASSWVSNAFTTGSGGQPAPGGTTGGPATSAAPQPTPTIVVPTPVVNVTVPTPTSTAVPPETPAYIWIIIAIGAVLVIAVIVLIARTRRV